MASLQAVPVSVLIPTIGRRNLLRSCISSVFACDPPADEVLIVEQGNEASAQSLVDEVGPGRARVVSCDGRGVARATNLGLREARHDLVLVTHDDCTVRSDWVAIAFLNARAVPGGIVTGRVLPPEGSDYVPSTKSSSDEEDFTGRIRTGALFPNNMILSASAAAKIGGFDERWGLRHAEDNDFCYRWLRCGGSLRYLPELVVWHHDWRGPDELVRTHVNYARGQGAFYAKHLYLGDRQVLPLLRRDLRAWARGLFRSPLDRPPRWYDPDREVVPYLLLGIAEGWLEARRLSHRAVQQRSLR